MGFVFIAKWLCNNYIYNERTTLMTIFFPYTNT